MAANFLEHSFDVFIEKVSPFMPALIIPNPQSFQTPTIRERHGGWKKEGGRPHQGHPSQTGGLDPPSSGTFSMPPQGSLLCLFLYKTPRLSRPEALKGGPETFRGGVRSLMCFAPPHVLHPPYHCPTLESLPTTEVSNNLP